jgi:predicted RNase H-like HicB family nuclease
MKTGSSSYHVPGSEAAIVYGKTIDEALERIREAIAVCVKDS